MGQAKQDMEDPLEDKFDQVGDYRIFTDDIIGRGSFGKVYKARKIGSEEILACKVITKSRLENRSRC